MLKWRVFKKNEKGLTLIEVLLAELLVGIIVIALLVALASAYKFVSFIDARETAKNLAEFEMQYIKSDRVPFVLGTTSYASFDPTTVGYIGFTVLPIAVQSGSQPPNPDVQLVTITVTGRNVTYTLSGYKVNY